jgi:anti-sigma regulatory factor (Ser/Thr protein kinase)
MDYDRSRTRIGLVRTGATAVGERTAPHYRHDALFYGSDEDFLAAAAPFVREAVAADEPVLVITSASRLEQLGAVVGTGGEVTYEEMDEVGRNPGRIIAVWNTFVRDHAASGRALRGIGEPVHAERAESELVECQLHEDLLNLAFPDETRLWLMCPYDTRTLPEPVLAEARRSHPYLMHGGSRQPSTSFRRIDGSTAFARQLPPAPDGAELHPFLDGMLGEVRAALVDFAARAGLDETRADDLVLAVNELTTNSLRHGGGAGELRLWSEPDRVICEVTDRGHITGPLTGRIPPSASAFGGRGLWMANQLCDLVQICSTASGGTTVRVHVLR